MDVQDVKTVEVPMLYQIPGGIKIVAYFEFTISTQRINHERTVYNLWDLLGDYGGFKEGLSIVIALLLGPVPEHLFLIKSIQKLFLA